MDLSTICSKQQGYDGVNFPTLEKSCYKTALQKRNRWMVQNRDFMIAYIRRRYGGARQTYQFAKKLSMMIKNVV